MGVAPACVTVTCWVSPLPVTVIVPTRWLGEVFVVKFAVMVPLPLPLVVVVSQVALSETVQLTFEVTEKLVVPEALATLRLDGVTVRVGTIVVNVSPLPERVGLRVPNVVVCTRLKIIGISYRTGK